MYVTLKFHDLQRIWSFPHKNHTIGTIMPFARSQTDIIIGSHDIEKGIDTVQCSMLLQHWMAKKWIDAEGLWATDAICFGGVTSVQMEKAEMYRLYANHQGGYRVFCPHCSSVMTSEFVEYLRKKNIDSNVLHSLLSCRSCGKESTVLYSLDGVPRLRFSPQAGFSKGALVLHNVAHNPLYTGYIEFSQEGFVLPTSVLTPSALEDIQKYLGIFASIEHKQGLFVIAKRVG